MAGRRYVVTAAVQAAVALALFPPRGMAQGLTSYPVTRETIGRSREAEMQAHHRYAAFAQQAKADGYPGIAYLFTALATAEMIHGTNFEKILTGLRVELTPVAAREIQVGTTQQNLIKAAADELESVDTFYPGILRQLKPEAFQDAITMTTYAWATEKQHLKILKSIQRWTPKHFDAVARKIEKETGQYFVCQVCGATMVKLPRGKCPVCRSPADNLHKVEPPV
jgi:rubrerythrin